jgi:aspartate dehydrogenase
MKVAIIGFGAIGRALAQGIAGTGTTLVGVLEREEAAAAARERLPASIVVTSVLDELLALEPAVVVECAGHAALRASGARVLRAGRDLIVASVGALASPELESELRSAAEAGGRVIIPCGALGGLDALGSAKRAGLDAVHYVSRKAPVAWTGTKAESLIDLASVTKPQVFYEGTAREAALDFPQNANVVAAVALAGIGFDRTRVKLMVDPDTPGNRHLVTASGPFGELSAEVLARTLPDNPKTSMLAPYSLLRAVANQSDRLVIS